MSNIEILEVQQNYQDENTTVWGEIDGESFGACFEANPTPGYSVKAENGFNVSILDCDGCPIPECDWWKNGSFEQFITLSEVEFG